MFVYSRTNMSSSKRPRELEEIIKFGKSKKERCDKNKIAKNDDEDNEDEIDIHAKGLGIEELFGGSKDTVWRRNNHIYFKTNVTKKSVEEMIKLIDEIIDEYHETKVNSKIYDVVPKPIYLHITTNGGDLHMGFYAYDIIKNSPIPIYTVVEGIVASAGTVMAIAGAKRYMMPNAYYLIHQLSTGVIGTFENISDHHKNITKFMNNCVRVYSQNCNKKLSAKQIREILKRDIYWNFAEVKKNGFVDEVYTREIGK